jgi:hypothetical protein
LEIGKEEEEIGKKREEIRKKRVVSKNRNSPFLIS